MPHGASSKNFWKFCKPFFSNNNKFWRQNYTGWKRRRSLSNEEIATHFNNNFNGIAKGVNIKKWSISYKLSNDQLVSAIRKDEHHPSISKIKSSVETTIIWF